MRRANLLLLSVTVLLGGCNDHPLKIVEYQYFTGEAPDDDAGGSDDEGSSDDETGSGDGDTGDETDTGDDAGETGMGDGDTGEDDTGDDAGETGDDGGFRFDVGPVCGNGVVEPGEDCDDGEDNGPFAPCSDSCFSNAQ